MDRKQAARQRAQHGVQARSAVCGVRERMSFPGTLRAQLVEKKGKQLVQITGYASTVGKPYEMWDMFGPYTETVAPGAFDKTLAANPDMNFVPNHVGVSMARTLNGTLDVEADPLGLRYNAFVNPQRNDVSDLVHAIEDGDVAESSFKFLITDGEWNEDWDAFTILEVDLDRGDVSAVNFGANPDTSVAVRSDDLMQQLDRLPRGAQRAAYERLGQTLRAAGDVDDSTNSTQLMQAVDAALDEAMDLISGIDTTNLDPDVAQALSLIGAADSACDELMAATGTDDPDERARRAGTQQRGAIAVHHTSTVDTTWNGPAAVAAADSEAELKYMHAWVDSSGDPTTKSSYKLPHHAAGTDTAANLNGVRNALSRLEQENTDIPDGDKAAVRKHLEAHLNDGDGGEESHHHPEATGRSVRLVELALAARG